jgi:hypothetical protein
MLVFCPRVKPTAARSTDFTAALILDFGVELFVSREYRFHKIIAIDTVLTDKLNTLVTLAVIKQ